MNRKEGLCLVVAMAIIVGGYFVDKHGDHTLALWMMVPASVACGVIVIRYSARQDVEAEAKRRRVTTVKRKKKQTEDEYIDEVIRSTRCVPPRPDDQPDQEAGSGLRMW